MKSWLCLASGAACVLGATVSRPAQAYTFTLSGETSVSTSLSTMLSSPITSDFVYTLNPVQVDTASLGLDNATLTAALSNPEATLPTLLTDRLLSLSVLPDEFNFLLGAGGLADLSTSDLSLYTDLIADLLPPSLGGVDLADYVDMFSAFSSEADISAGLTITGAIATATAALTDYSLTLDEATGSFVFATSAPANLEVCLTDFCQVTGNFNLFTDILMSVPFLGSIPLVSAAIDGNFRLDSTPVLASGDLPTMPPVPAVPIEPSVPSAPVVSTPPASPVMPTAPELPTVPDPSETTPVPEPLSAIALIGVLAGGLTLRRRSVRV